MNFFTRWFCRSNQPIVNRGAVRSRRCQLEVLALEERALPSATLYSVDGTGNNLGTPSLGSAGTDLVRISPTAYADGISAPSLPNNASARVISDLLNNQAAANTTEDISTVDKNNLSDFGYAWGQFLDHDLDLTTTNAKELLTILADPNDTSQMGDETFARSTSDPATGTSTGNPRQQVNAVTSFLDLSQVYGSSVVIADALRTHSGGLMKTSPGNMLPYDNSAYFTATQLAAINMANDSHMVATASLFVTGDVRGNENVELTALQTLFVRNHNKIATALRTEHPGWTDEQLYQEARKLNIAEYQQITYNNYLPDLLGQGAISRYTGYKPNVDPAIATEFSTVGFRFGHSLLSAGIERHGNNGLDVLPGDKAGAGIDLATDFFDPNVLNPAGVVDPFTGHTSTDIDPILKGDADGISQADDLMAISDIRNLLFANSGVPNNGTDLMARDVERARDDGIGSYNQVRAAYGLPQLTSFAQITSDVTVQNELKAAYGSVNNIDPFEGGLAEAHVPGSDMGPLFTRILVDQFTRLRDGDRLFYLNQTFNQDELRIMQQGNTLAKVIEANTHVTNLQSDVFLFKASISGTVTLHSVGARQPQHLGLPGLVVQLKDDSGNIVATTLTDLIGHYAFNQQNGVSGTGTYTIALLVPAGFTALTTTSATVAVSAGGSNANGINFSLGHATWSWPKPAHFDGMDPFAQAPSFDVFGK